MQNCFLMPSLLKSHIILVLDRLQCVARVNCLVTYNAMFCVTPVSEFLKYIVGGIVT